MLIFKDKVDINLFDAKEIDNLSYDLVEGKSFEHY